MVFGRDYPFPGSPPFLTSELAEVVPCRENAHSAHWFSQMMFTGLFQGDAQTLHPHHYSICTEISKYFDVTVSNVACWHGDKFHISSQTFSSLLPRFRICLFIPSPGVKIFTVVVACTFHQIMSPYKNIPLPNWASDRYISGDVFSLWGWIILLRCLVNCIGIIEAIWSFTV